MKRELQSIIEDHIKCNGISMQKQISSGGLMTYPTYDKRIVYSTKDLNRLTAEGFCVDEDLGVFLFNAFTDD